MPLVVSGLLLGETGSALTWILALGPDGIREVAETAVLNANYLAARLREVPGMSQPFPTSNTPIEQFRWSLDELAERTGVTSFDVSRNLADYGLQPVFTSHHPYLVPNPMTPEPPESFSKNDLDTFADAVIDIARRAEANADDVLEGPYRNACRRIDAVALDDPQRWVPSSRSERSGARTLLDEVRYVELSDRSDFQDKFVGELALPTRG